MSTPARTPPTIPGATSPRATEPAANRIPTNAPASAHCLGFSGSGGRDWMRSRSRLRLLLPLDRARGLARDVEHDAVDLADLVDHARGDLLEQVVGQPRPVGRHRVVGGHGADRDQVAVRALVALHADGADVGQHAEGLPQLAVQAGLADL